MLPAILIIATFAIIWYRTRPVSEYEEPEEESKIITLDEFEESSWHQKYEYLN